MLSENRCDGEQDVDCIYCSLKYGGSYDDFGPEHCDRGERNYRWVHCIYWTRGDPPSADQCRILGIN